MGGGGSFETFELRGGELAIGNAQPVEPVEQSLAIGAVGRSIDIQHTAIIAQKCPAERGGGKRLESEEAGFGGIEFVELLLDVLHIQRIDIRTTGVNMGVATGDEVLGGLFIAVAGGTRVGTSVDDKFHIITSFKELPREAPDYYR